MATPKLLAMFIKQGIEGDDALLRLAQVRFQEAGVGAELYPGSPEQMKHQLAFRPTGQACTVHLPRGLNLLQAAARDRIMEFAVAAAGPVDGLILHDHAEFADQTDAVLAAFADMDRRLAAVPNAPWLFVEYAVGLTPDQFATYFEKTTDLRHVSACIDVSHVGIRACQRAYEAAFPGVDVCALKTAPDLPDRIEAIQRVVAGALATVAGLVARLARLGKRLHFHLHDGHPLSTLSMYGVSDHLSFMQEVRIPFAHHGRQLLGGMFGPAGLRTLVQTALHELAAEQLSFMIEVHPQEGRSPLGPHGALFAHWKDRSNAERMNYWIDMLLLNARLVREAAWDGSSPGVATPGH